MGTREDERAARALGRGLADERKRAGLTQERLAYLCGLNPKYISHIETGLKTPTLRTFRRIATALKLAPWELLRRIDQDASLPGRRAARCGYSS